MRASLLLLVAVAAVARAEDPRPWLFAPVDGNLSGEVALRTIAGAPVLHWTLTNERGSDRVQHVALAVDGPGTKIRVEAELDAASQTGTWKITAASLDLATWNQAIGQRLSAPPGVTLTGKAGFTGSGVYRNRIPSGEIGVVIRDATVRDTSAGWRLDGVGLDARFAIDLAAATIRSAAPLTLTVKTITTSRFGARNLTVDGELKDGKTFALRSAQLEIAGGEMSAAPCTVDLTPFAIAVDLTLNRIGLQDVAALVPNALVSAYGRVDGVVHLSWSTASGFELGQGHLVLRSDAPAEVTLKPAPGLFTARMNEWVVRWILPALRRAELGQVPIEAKSLDIAFSPIPDAEGRTAVIHLTGSPKGKQRIPIEMDTNVHGPLQTFIDLGTKQGVSLGVGVH